MKKKKIWLKKGITTVLAASMFLTGCAGNQSVRTDSMATQENEESKRTEAGTQKTKQAASESAANTQTRNDELVQRLQQKYAGASAGEYDGNVIKVKRDEPVTLKLDYNPNESDENRSTTAGKQEAIQEKVDEIVSSIISGGMSDLEKETAINEYLCQNASYDNAALDNAEQNSFQYVDERFYDSFTAYGILMDGVGVCAGYSAAFKLLADAAGIESIVVTGYLDGSLPHAWNKVRIDGEWYIVADRLAEAISADGSAVLRTDYDMGDEEFGDIAQQTADKAQKNVVGFYWMGVIHLES